MPEHVLVAGIGPLSGISGCDLVELTRLLRCFIAISSSSIVVVCKLHCKKSNIRKIKRAQNTF